MLLACKVGAYLAFVFLAAELVTAFESPIHHALTEAEFNALCFPNYWL